MFGPQRRPERTARVAPAYEPATAAAAPMVCFLWRPARLVGFPPGSSSRRVSQPGGLYVPRQQTVTFHLEGCRFRRSARRRQRCAGPPDARDRERPSSELLLVLRNGGPVTTILSHEGRSPRMTFRMCRISSRRGTQRGALARQPGHLATSTWRRAFTESRSQREQSDSRKKLDARPGWQGRAVE